MHFNVIPVKVETSDPPKRHLLQDLQPGKVYKMPEFVEQAAEIVRPFFGGEMTEVTAGFITNNINELLVLMEAHRCRVEFNTGVFLKKLEMRLLRGDESRGERTRIGIVRIWTDQWGSQTFPTHPGECAYLGKAFDDDLYIGYQGSLPPTLIFKYGPDPSNYTTFNPVLQDRKRVVTDRKYSDALMLYDNATKFITVNY